MNTIEQLIYDETKKRLEIMESEEYSFPEEANRKDAVIIISSIILCIALIGLCMIGVIK